MNRLKFILMLVVAALILTAIVVTVKKAEVNNQLLNHSEITPETLKY